MHIHLLRTPSPGITPVQEPVTKVQDQKRRDTNVGREEVADRPLGREEHGKPVDQHHQGGTSHAEDGTVRLQAGLVGLLDSLGGGGLAEAEEDHATADPGNKAGGIGKVDEPVEHDGTRVADGEVGQCGETGRGADGIVRDTPAVTGLEDARGVAGHGERVQGARRHVEERISRGPGGGQDRSVDDMVEHGDPRIFDAHHEGRGLDGAVTCGQLRGVGWADHTDGQNTQNVEEDQTVDVAAGGPRYVATGGLHLATTDDDQFGGEDEGDGTGDGALEQPDKTTGIARHQILVKGTGIFPVVEPKSLTVRTTAPEQNEGDHEQTDQGDNLDSREPKLGFTVEAHGEEVEGNNHDHHDGDPHGNVDGCIGIPISNDQPGCRDLVGYQDSEGVPVEITHGETHATRDISKPVVTHGTTVNGEVSSNLGDGGDQPVDHGGDEDVAHKKGGRPTGSKRLTGSNEQT